MSTGLERLEKNIEVSKWLERYGELLTPKQQHFLHLYYNEDFTLNEVAQELGVSRQNVHDLIHRALQKLSHYESILQLQKKSVISLKQINKLENLLVNLPPKEQEEATACLNALLQNIE